MTDLEQLKNVETHIKVGEFGVKSAEVGIVDIFKYQ